MPLVRAEIVRNHRDMAVGLMGRKHLPKNAGMLFDFGSDQPLAFWMKNTYIPLQIAFIDSKGVIAKVSSMAPLSTRSVRSDRSCRYALEVNEGWFDENNVRVGATVTVPGMDEEPKGNLAEGGAEVDGEAQKPSPAVVVEQSFKDILSAASEYGVPVVVKGSTKDGYELPAKLMVPPFVFGDTAEGDVNGLVTAWSASEAHPTSFVVDLISEIADQQGQPILNAARIAELKKGIPNKVVDDMSAKGKLI